MKKCLLIGLILASLEANATGYGGFDLNVISKSQSGALAIGGDSSAVNGGNSVEFRDRLQIPNSPGLSSGSSNTTAPHRIYRQRQKSFPIFGYTNIDMVLDLPDFIKSEPNEDVQLAACIQDEGFREWRRLKNKPCPTEPIK